MTLPTGISDPPYQGNVVTDPRGAEATPGFLSRLTQIWIGWMRTLTTWANVQGTTQVNTFSAGDYVSGGGGGTWVVGTESLVNYTSRLMGDTLQINVDIAAKPAGVVHSTVTGTVNYLRIKLPPRTSGAYTVAESHSEDCKIFDNATTATDGFVSCTASDDHVNVFKNDLTPFAASAANGTGVNFGIAFRVTIS